VGLAAGAVMALALIPNSGRAANPTQPTFAATYVSNTLAGGEPFVIYSHAGNDLVYAAHEGTTHTYKPGLTNTDSACDILPPRGGTPSGFVCEPYDNHINQWYSTDGGKTWTLDGPANPLAGNEQDTGFSDPSLTEDAPPATGPSPQNVYDTGIDLANDALYASNDGGKTWGGTPDCVQGDRPWLAGGHNNEVFLATDLEGAEPSSNGKLTSGHAYFHGLVQEAGGVIVNISCNPNGIQDPAGGDAQDYYDHITGDIIEGASNFKDGGFGIGVLPNASNAWPSAATDPTNTGAPTGAFVDSEGTDCKDGTVAEPPGTDGALCTELGPIDPEIALDSANNTYVVWATNPRSSSNGNGCNGTGAGGAAVEPNSVYMIYTPDEGKTWKGPYTIADPTTSHNTTMIWPFIVAGSNGNVAIAWYQSNQLTDPDCDSAAQLPGGQPTQWTLQETTIQGVNTASYPPASVNAFPAAVCCDTFGNAVPHPNGVFHVGGICQSGTTCVATGQDRRLGDYFTDALDPNGCVLIATGDTDMPDANTGGQLAWSRPVVLEQASGNSLTTGQPCASPISTVPGMSTPEAPAVPALAVLGFIGVGAGWLVRRRRSPRGTM
jgi:MYXO-CTERM domain-containing protein